MSQSSVQAMKPEQGLFELTLLNAETSSASFDDVVIDALDRGVPAELVTRLKAIWVQTKFVSGEIVAIGKIVVTQIVEFLRTNPRLTIGLALGAAVATLIGGIPFIGAMLQPLSSLVTTLYGAGVGAAMEKGDYSGSPFTAAIELAHKFFELLVSVFNAVASQF